MSAVERDQQPGDNQAAVRGFFGDGMGDPADRVAVGVEDGQLQEPGQGYGSARS